MVFRRCSVEDTPLPVDGRANGAGWRTSSWDANRIQVEYAPKAGNQQILSFYMGKNTPERKDYIMENLVVTVMGKEPE